MYSMGNLVFNNAQTYRHQIFYRKGEFYIKYDHLVVYFSMILFIFSKNVESGKPYLETDADMCV